MTKQISAYKNCGIREIFKSYKCDNYYAVDLDFTISLPKILLPHSNYIHVYRTTLL